jgi:hypothetical protein
MLVATCVNAPQSFARQRSAPYPALRCGCFHYGRARWSAFPRDIQAEQTDISLPAWGLGLTDAPAGPLCRIIRMDDARAAPRAYK